ncbi:hypothetical protein M422DRAFT_247438 [Sphaerobolus stellatus SS14]|nr:hypothetical protein M422DRAFT_247438 [Sphaerobolus stellatus SS14]
MSHKCVATRRARADELSMQAVGDDSGDAVAATVPSWEQSPLRPAGPSQLAIQGLNPCRLAGMSGTAPWGSNSPSLAHRGSASPCGVTGHLGTATQGTYSSQGIGQDSGSWQNSGDVMSDPELVSPNLGDTDEGEDFIIPANEVSTLHQEYTDLINLRDNTEIVVMEAMEATKQANTMFTRIRASINRMSLRMKGKTCELGNNRAHDKTAVKAATAWIISQTNMMVFAPESGAEERARTTRLRVPGNQYSRSHRSRNINKDIPSTACIGQVEDLQPRRSREAHTEYARATHDSCVTDKSCADRAHDICIPEALEANAQYWSDLTEEKVNNLLQEDAPEEELLELAREVQNMLSIRPKHAIIATAGREHNSPFRSHGIPSMNEAYTPQPESYAPYGRHGTPTLSTTAQLDGVVVNMTCEYSGVQLIVRQALRNALDDGEPEKSVLAKTGVKMGNPPTYAGERNLKKFETWGLHVLHYMVMYNLLDP